MVLGLLHVMIQYPEDQLYYELRAILNLATDEGKNNVFGAVEPSAGCAPYPFQKIVTVNQLKINN